MEIGEDLLAHFGEWDLDDVVGGAGQFLELGAEEIGGAGDGAALAGRVDANGKLLALPGGIGLAFIGRVPSGLGGLGLVFVRRGPTVDHLLLRRRLRRWRNLDLLLDDLFDLDGLLYELFDDLLDDDRLLNNLWWRSGCRSASRNHRDDDHANQQSKNKPFHRGPP